MKKRARKLAELQSEVRALLGSPDLVGELRRLYRDEAEARVDRIRRNLRTAMQELGRDESTIQTFSGVSLTTTRGFVREKNPADSSITNVTLMALVCGLSGVADLDQEPDAFRERLREARAAMGM